MILNVGSCKNHIKLYLLRAPSVTIVYLNISRSEVALDVKRGNLMKFKTFKNVDYCEPLTGRVTDAKNRVWVGTEVSKALKEGKAVYVIIGEEIKEL